MRRDFFGFEVGPKSVDLSVSVGSRVAQDTGWDTPTAFINWAYARKAAFLYPCLSSTLLELTQALCLSLLLFADAILPSLLAASTSNIIF